MQLIGIDCECFDWNKYTKKKRSVFRFPEHIIDYTDCKVNLNDQV